MTIAATDPDACENGPDLGEFAITRSGDLTNSLDVHFTLAGTATEDADYPALTRHHPGRGVPCPPSLKLPADHQEP